MSMSCPKCGAWSSVKETRSKPDNLVYRRYECANLHRFSTEERIKDELLRRVRKLQSGAELPCASSAGRMELSALP